MLVVEPPQWDLAPAALTLGEGVGVFLHNPDNIPPVMNYKVQVQAIPDAVGPWKAREGAGSSLS